MSLRNQCFLESLEKTNYCSFNETDKLSLDSWYFISLVVWKVGSRFLLISGEARVLPLTPVMM